MADSHYPEDQAALSAHCRWLVEHPGSLPRHNRLTIVGVKRNGLGNVAAVRELGKVLLDEVKSMQPLRGYLD